MPGHFGFATESCDDCGGFRVFGSGFLGVLRLGFLGVWGLLGLRAFRVVGLCVVRFGVVRVEFSLSVQDFRV